ncbi:MAG: hypothetical protein HDR02_04985 [Lachnospiraceae bacterium]|nr:hypothetical protein [Lachnospiraceae bacterium]
MLKDYTIDELIAALMTKCGFVAVIFQKMVAFFNGYLEAYDNCFRAYSGVFGLAYTWVEWLDYNIQRGPLRDSPALQT